MNLRSIRERLFSVFRKRQLDRELEGEIAAHLEQAEKDNILAGMTGEEARRAARRQFGDIEPMKEQYRDQRGWPYLQDLGQDLKHSLRMIGRSPGFCALIVATLALGIGATTAIFSVLYAVMLRPLPYQDPEQLIILWTTSPEQGSYEEPTAYPNYEDWKDQSETFQDMATFWHGSFLLSGPTENERVQGAVVTANLFPLLGIDPVLGRLFTTEDEQRRERVVLLGHGLWQRRFGGSLDVIDETLEMDSGSPRVIGVLPADFRFPTKDVQLWEPITSWQGWTRAKANRRMNLWNVIGRLRPDKTLDEAQVEMRTIAERLEEKYPGPNQGKSVVAVPLLEQMTGPQTGLTLWLLFGAVLTVLMILSANVAGLILARGVQRQREIAIRTALGASGLRVARQMLTESMTVGLMAGLLGIALAFLGVRVLIAYAPGDLPRLEEIGIDHAVLAFSVGLSLLVGVLFGLGPVWQALRSRIRDSLQDGEGPSVLRRNRFHARGMLVISELALAVILLTGAGLLLRSLLNVHRVDPGFVSEGVLTMQVVVPPRSGPVHWAESYEQMLERVQSLPGVQAAGLILNHFVAERDTAPVATEGSSSSGRPPLEPIIGDPISPGYFSALNVPLLSGRFFSEQDTARSEWVVIVNQTLARQNWPGEDPVGKRIKFGSAQSRQPWMTVVGVVGDIKRRSLEQRSLPQAFQPFRQSPLPGMDLVVRTTSAPQFLANAIRSEVRQVDKMATISGVTTMDRQLAEFSSWRRFQTWLLGLFSLVAVIVAAIGIYGLMHHSVVHRTREIGIRIALGAGRGEVLRMVLAQGLTLTLIGLTLGLAGSFGLTRVLENMLFDVTPTDPVTFLVVTLLLAGVTVLAGYIPARRATKVDPMTALRHE